MNRFSTWPRQTARLAFTLALMLAGTACRGCDGEAPTAERVAQDEHAMRMARLQARELDRSKSYPKAKDGSVSCGTDVDCFLIQAERCIPATLRRTHVADFVGLAQIAEAEYRIVSRAGDKCLVTRRILRFDAKISDILAKALRSKGKTDQDLEDMRQQSLFRLRERYPPKIECTLEENLLLDQLLNFAEKKAARDLWREACVEVPGASLPVEGAADAAAPAAPQKPAVETAPDQPPDQPAAADAPASKQPQ